MKSTTQYALVGGVVIIAAIIIYLLVTKDTQAQQPAQSPIVTTASSVSQTPMPYTVTCGMVQDASGVVRQKIILLDARTGRTWSLDQNSGANFTWNELQKQ